MRQPHLPSRHSKKLGFCSRSSSGALDGDESVSSFVIRSRLRPDVVESVLLRNQVSDHYRLLDFFNWSEKTMGCPPTLASFSFLLVSLSSSSMFGLARVVAERMLRAHERAGHDRILESVAGANAKLGWNAVAFEILMDVYVGSGRMDDAARALHECRKVGLAPGLRFCNSLLRSTLKVNRMDMFWKVYDDIMGVGVEPDVYTFSILINAFCKIGQVDVARKMYSVLIHSLAKIGKMNEVLRIFAEMNEKNLAPDVYTYTGLISGFCKQGDMERAFHLHDEMLVKGVYPNIVTYNALIDGLLKSGEVTVGTFYQGEEEITLINYDILGRDEEVAKR
ncbi:Pentatricopeptide repeat-containing protein [Nymphaea thermarum]|nr:Pentatricopeptide repeat-containing protein [Nymphaea thermarum]